MKWRSDLMSEKCSAYLRALTAKQRVTSRATARISAVHAVVTARSHRSADRFGLRKIECVAARQLVAMSVSVERECANAAVVWCVGVESAAPNQGWSGGGLRGWNKALQPAEQAGTSASAVAATIDTGRSWDRELRGGEINAFVYGQESVQAYVGL